MTPDSIGILALASVGVIISGLRLLNWPFLSELVVAVQFTPHDPGFDWNFCFGICRRDNFWLETCSTGSVYQNWLYLFNVFLMTSDSTGILALAYVGAIISGMRPPQSGSLYQSWL